MAADVRLDNRCELGSSLNIPATALAKTADSVLLLKAWECWQERCFDRLLGDFAFAVWDAVAKRLTLARSANSLKPLFYYRGRGLIVFASTPQALLAAPGIKATPDFNEAAAIVAGLASRGSSTVFAGIQSVRHGTLVEVTESSEREIRHWHPERVERRPIAIQDAAASLRYELDRAVAAQLRRASGKIASQLSSGRDSSAVTASAAAILADEGQSLLALTGCPINSFVEPPSSTRLANESSLAALLAGRYANVEHVACSSHQREIGAELATLAWAHTRPLTNPSALHWSTEVDERARELGATVMLIGSTGNMSISASGPRHLIDVLRYGGIQSWIRHAIRIGGRSLTGWRNIGNISLGPFLPIRAYQALLKATGRDPGAGLQLPVLRQPYRSSAEQMLHAEFGNYRPPRDYHRFRCGLLLSRDNSDKSSLALSGLDVRDPTSDRRLVELCLSFPPELLVSRNFAPSPVYEAAFAQRIPVEMMHNRRRGIQGADWFMLFSRGDLEQCFDIYRRNPAVAELFDMRVIDRLVERWPESGPQDWAETNLFRYQLLAALAVAAFLAHQFPE